MEQSEILALIEKLTAKSKREARKISRKLEAGTIDVDEWKAAILALLVSSHIIAASVGRGGRSAMTSGDWQKVQRKIEWQGGYLEKFGRQIASGAIVIVAGVIAARAVKYFAAPFVSFANADRERAVEASPKDEREMLCRLVQNSKEGCDECTADAAEGWMPVSEMGEIGTRECGDWCLCFIEFQDEV